MLLSVFLQSLQRPQEPAVEQKAVCSGPSVRHLVPLPGLMWCHDAESAAGT